MLQGRYLKKHKTSYKQFYEIRKYVFRSITYFNTLHTYKSYADRSLVD